MSNIKLYKLFSWLFSVFDIIFHERRVTNYHRIRGQMKSDAKMKVHARCPYLEKEGAGGNLKLTKPFYEPRPHLLIEMKISRYSSWYKHPLEINNSRQKSKIVGLVFFFKPFEVDLPNYQARFFGKMEDNFSANLIIVLKLGKKQYLSVFADF